MENIKPYNKYKPSGIAWLGDIPEHWERWKISRGVKNIGSGTTPSSGNKDFYENGTINWLNTGDFNNGILFKCKKKVTSKALQENSSLKLFPKGTLSIAMYGATIGKVCIIQFDATTNQACCNIVEGKIFDNKFLMYWFIGHKPHIVNLSYGGGQPNISQDVIKSLFVPCPIKSEQTAIANFLDYKTAKIDRFIRKKKQLIKLLNEQKAGIINHAVTKGLDPNATMKNSGIEWLGDIPKHWEVRKLKYVAKICNGSDCDKKAEGKYPVYGSGGVFGWNESFLYDKPSVLLGRKGTIDKPILVNEPFWTVDTAFYTKIKTDLVDILFFYYLCCNIPFGFYSSKTALPSMTQTSLYEVKFSIPSVPEQQIIVQYIEKETSQLNQLIQTIEKEIALTQEYRTALIAEAVTGKIDVRAFVIPIVSTQEELYEEIEEEIEEELDMVAEDAESYENE